MTFAELDELLKKVRLRGSSYNSYMLLNPEQRAAIVGALLPEIVRRIEQANAEK